MRIKDEINIYVALDENGRVVQYFTDAEQAWDTETHISEDIVSVGYVIATPIDYDELFNTELEPETKTCPWFDQGSCDGPGICPECDKLNNVEDD